MGIGTELDGIISANLCYKDCFGDMIAWCFCLEMYTYTYRAVCVQCSLDAAIFISLHYRIIFLVF